MTFSMCFLFPEKGEDHDQGLTSWELTRVEETEENITRISYINDDNVWLFVPFGTGLYAIFRKKRMGFRITFIDNDRS